MKRIGIYVHIPFCKKKCNYCDFYSVSHDKKTEDKYIEALLSEINSYNSTNYLVDTIFIGGGTPTIIDPLSIKKTIQMINNTFAVDETAEISMEANPNSLTNEKLSIYKEAGINRLSIGIQSLNDDILKKIGRLHDKEQAIDAIERAKKIGFDNINVDIMFNIPDQTNKDIEDTLNRIIQQNINHISFYSLKLEKGTPMYRMEQNHKIIMPLEDTEREMYYKGREVMENSKIFQYEISNFSKEGYECKHNLKYWMQEEYIGIGPSAHSFLDNKRFSNPCSIENYVENAKKNIFNREIHEVLNKDDLMFEYIMLFLRLTNGLDINEFNKKFNQDFSKKYKEQIIFLTYYNLILILDNNIKLTNKGMDISNFVFEKFM